MLFVKKLFITWSALSLITVSLADTITIAADAWPPFNGDPDSTTPGYMVEIAREAFKAKGHTIVYRKMPWSRALLHAKQGKIEGVIGAVRKEVEEFIFPIHLGFYAPTAFVRKDSTWTFNSIADLKKVKVGIAQDYSYGKQTMKFINDPKNSLNVRAATGNDPLKDNIRLLQAKRIDAILASKPVFDYISNQLGIGALFKEAGSVETPDPMYIAFSPENPKAAEYAAILSEGVTLLRESGRLAEILARYNLTDWVYDTPHSESKNARNMNTLRLLVWEGYAPKKYVEAFEQYIEQKYGRKVNLEVACCEDSDEFYTETRAKRVDLVTLTHNLFKDERFNFIKNEMLLPLDLRNIDNFKHIANGLQNATFLHDQNDTYAVPICQGPYGLAYNADKMAGPDSWQVLWKPEYKKRYVIASNEYLYNVCMTAMAWGYKENQIADFKSLNNKSFRAKLKELAQNADSFWTGQDTATALSGKSLATVWGDSLGTLRKRGENWHLSDPKEKSLCWVDCYAVTWSLKGKPFMKRVAEEFINSVLLPEYQVDHLFRELTLSPVTTNIGDKLSKKELSKLNIDKPDYFSENRILLPTCSRKDRNGIKLLWNEAMKGINSK